MGRHVFFLSLIVLITGFTVMAMVSPDLTRLFSIASKNVFRPANVVLLPQVSALESGGFAVFDDDEVRFFDAQGTAGFSKPVSWPYGREGRSAVINLFESSGNNLWWFSIKTTSDGKPLEASLSFFASEGKSETKNLSFEKEVTAFVGAFASMEGFHWIDASLNPKEKSILYHLNSLDKPDGVVSRREVLLPVTQYERDSVYRSNVSNSAQLWKTNRTLKDAILLQKYYIKRTPGQAKKELILETCIVKPSGVVLNHLAFQPEPYTRGGFILLEPTIDYNEKRKQYRVFGTLNKPFTVEGLYLLIYDEWGQNLHHKKWFYKDFGGLIGDKIKGYPDNVENSMRQFYPAVTFEYDNYESDPASGNLYLELLERAADAKVSALWTNRITFDFEGNLVQIDRLKRKIYYSRNAVQARFVPLEMTGVYQASSAPSCGQSLLDGLFREPESGVSAYFPLQVSGPCRAVVFSQDKGAALLFQP